MSLSPLFRPVALGAHLLALVLVSIAVLLGFWQLGSWQEQREDEATNRQALEPVPLADALGPDQPFPKAEVGRSVEVSGTWLPDSTLYVSDRPHGEDDGYWAVTPVAVGSGPGTDPATAPALLVVRGWVSDPAEDTIAPQGPVELVGWLQPPEGTSGVVDDDSSDAVIPQMRMADAIQHVDQDLYGGYLVLDPERAAAAEVTEAADGLAPVDLEQLPDVAASTGLKNLLYGVEWFIFAAFAAFIWLRWCADEVARAREERLQPAGNLEA
ncbi:SURF1 family protein [Nocardioides campestrisoli]|uniref:SURF1 family protein n=1 Tax=Nocardioides campestrisoli TaxID=2736757 RepID=UPI0015E75638|nr:SURF1 family protein [Nocardioides campestrisoli]